MDQWPIRAFLVGYDPPLSPLLCPLPVLPSLSFTVAKRTPLGGPGERCKIPLCSRAKQARQVLFV